MDWLIQEAAKDLVNTEEEEEAIAVEHGGERKEEEGVGEEGGAARRDEDLPKEGGVKAEEGVGGEEEGGDRIEKQGGALEKEEVSSGVGEDADETSLKGEEQGGDLTEEGGGDPTGEGERFLRLGLKAEGGAGRSFSWPEGSKTGEGLSIGLHVSKEALEDGRLEVDCESCRSGSLVSDAACWPAAVGRSCGRWLVNVGRRSTGLDSAF